MLNEFKTEFREFPKFPNYVISCDCDYTKIISTVISKEQHIYIYITNCNQLFYLFINYIDFKIFFITNYVRSV